MALMLVSMMEVMMVAMMVYLKVDWMVAY